MNALTLSIGILVGALLLHLVEEVCTGFRKRLPMGEMPKLTFVGINIGIYGYSFVMLIYAVRDHPLAIAMAWPFAIGMLLNGLGHIGIMLHRKAYFPGGGTAVLLLATAANLIGQLLIQ